LRVLFVPRLLLKNDGVVVEHFCPLDPEPAYQPPDTWDAPHVQHRFSEAIGTLAKLPLGRFFPTAIYTCWPGYSMEWDHFMGRMTADIESMAVEGKLDPEFVTAYQTWTIDRNRWRERPAAADISVMERALAWPGAYLRDQIELARALNLCGVAQARGMSVRDVVRRGKHADVRSPTQWNQLALTAANTIAVGLRIDRIAVF
jgi:hypothetical protein